MVSSWSMFISQCKSRWSAIARSCFLGREAAQEKRREIADELKETLTRGAKERAQLEATIRGLQSRVAELEAQLAAERAQSRPVELPLGEAPPEMQYGAGLIALCVNLAREIGFRPTVRALTIVFGWLQADVAIPAYQSILGWAKRLGLFRLQNGSRKGRGVWVVDHTNQIGKEKVLVILNVPADRPRDAGPLRQEEVEVLGLAPAESWKREDVLERYVATAERCGVPRGIASDGAPELQEAIAMLGEKLAKKPGKKLKQPLAFRDPKHFLSNQLERLLTRDPAWPKFTAHLASTRSAVQQTELAHLTPPPLKTKARFMNLAATLRWARAALWHADHPNSQSRRGITPERWEEKLGWLPEFAPNLREWQACQDVVSTALTFLNKRGLFRGATQQLRKLVRKFEKHPLSKQLIQALLKFAKGYEDQLTARERLPISTEILESCFAKFKQLEQQHSKGGFTSLLLTFPVLLRPTAAAEITASMQSVKVAAIDTWQQNHLPHTLTSRRQLLYREAKPKTTRTKQKRATTITTDN